MHGSLRLILRTVARLRVRKLGKLHAMFRVSRNASFNEADGRRRTKNIPKGRKKVPSRTGGSSSTTSGRLSKKPTDVTHRCRPGIVAGEHLRVTVLGQGS